MAHASDSKGKRTSKSNKLVVAAIDFGTTYSGYAFSFANEFKDDPTKVYAQTKWVAGSGALMSLKTPTILLLNKDKTFNAFGYEAENAYTELAEDGEHEDYYYFRRFKMMLYNSTGLKRNIEIEDGNGHKMKALTVFGIAIKYLKGHLMDNLRNKIHGIIEEDIRWVLTVPAIWNDGSKQFMREAAEMAGIKRENLVIALEPEAASLFCMHLPVDKMSMEGSMSDSMRVSPFSKGTKYMVVDVGGGTVDITLHEVIESDKLKELDSANGGAWGGTRVDAAYENFLKKITGDKAFKRFQKEAAEDLIDLYREFETKKRNVVAGKTGRETIKIPVRLAEIYENESGKTIKTRISEIKEFKDKVSWMGDKVRLDMEIVKSWYDESCKNTVEHIKKIFKHKKSAGVNTILLVGGFSESPMLQEALKTNFKDKRVIIPEDAGLVVLKGAVIFGHNPITIVSRVAKCSYGVRVYRDFKPGEHPENKKVQVGRRVKCKDVFACHVKKGQELVVGEAQSKQRYTPLEADQMTLVFDVYTSTEEHPQYVTDVDCTYVGQLEVEVPDLSGGKDRGVWVKLIFGGTEVIVEGEDEKTKKVTKASFDFLQ
ncbi:heat shock 70 kDa protein 12A-like [Mercenaria mercenaria]|uniref:heat shock 70 kDa protein 12A-like n=1 Tax=Mercenaria mercenaria TaxID=6596 RepID=UPI00234E65EB|nr:heat shock 70 kDa protein 12A-like [Mercenaria mercenaria]XP_053400021.1 heat shock 70 kDa protein 12A-like [Mercenaria mercenaria]